MLDLYLQEEIVMQAIAPPHHLLRRDVEKQPLIYIFILEIVCLILQVGRVTFARL